MQLVIAIIKPSKLTDVRDALAAVGCSGMTVTEVRGFGRQQGHTELYRGAEYRIDLLPKLRLDIAVTAQQLERVLDAIVEAAHSGQTGDGKVFVLPLQQAIRIRTGETDTNAL